MRINIGTLWQLRKEHGLTLLDVSQALGYKTPGAYWKIENGKQAPSLEQLKKLSDLYNVDMDIFFDRLFTEMAN